MKLQRIPVKIETFQTYNINIFSIIFWGVGLNFSCVCILFYFAFICVFLFWSVIRSPLKTRMRPRDFRDMLNHVFIYLYFLYIFNATNNASIILIIILNYDFLSKLNSIIHIFCAVFDNQIYFIIY